MPSSAKYIIRLDLGPIIYGNEPPVTHDVSQERASRSIVSTFQYCHNQSEESQSFAMQNEVSVSGIIKAFDVSVSHAHQYANACSKAQQSGSGIETYQDDYAKDTTRMEHKVGEGEVLLGYCELNLLCFNTPTDSTKRFLHVPNSAPIIRCINKDELSGMATTHNLDEDSWDIIAKQWGIETKNIKSIRDALTPLAVQSGSGTGDGTLELEDGEYKMFNKLWGGPLFCGDNKDSANDHWAWVEERRNYENNGKERVLLKKQSDGTYKIFSKKWQGPLFCGDNTDDAGDHWAWFEERPGYENNGKERWTIERQSDGYYKLFNKKWGGPLFCGDKRQSDVYKKYGGLFFGDNKDISNDHWVWVESRRNFENNGKERWEFKKM